MRDYPDEIHWHRLVRNLRAVGMTYKEIAMETGFAISELREMEMEEYWPPFLSIIKLLDLHVARCPNRHKNIGVIYPEELE